MMHEALRFGSAWVRWAWTVGIQDTQCRIFRLCPYLVRLEFACYLLSDTVYEKLPGIGSTALSGMLGGLHKVLG